MRVKPRLRTLLWLACLLVPAACRQAPQTPLPEPRLGELQPASLNFTATVGQTVRGSLAFRNTGAANLAFSVDTGLPWLSPSPRKGVVAPGAAGAVSVSATCPGTPDVYSGTLAITSNDPAATVLAIPVSLHCEPAPEGGFHIELRFADSGLSSSQRAVFRSAADRWAKVIVGDLRDVAGISVPANGCYPGSQPYSGPIDDLLIDVATTTVDGPGGVLGSAGPCLVHNDSYLPLYGAMAFDQADVDWLEQAGRLQDTILHEMGHVLGIGTLWQPFELLDFDADTCQNASQIAFLGPDGQREYAAMGGSGNVPVEENGRSGTKCGHWDEETFGAELMTGWLSSNSANPLSPLTVGSLADLGYSVDYSAADRTPLSTLAPQGVSESYRLDETLILPRPQSPPPGDG